MLFKKYHQWNSWILRIGVRLRIWSSFFYWLLIHCLPTITVDTCCHPTVHTKSEGLRLNFKEHLHTPTATSQTIMLLSQLLFCETYIWLQTTCRKITTWVDVEKINVKLNYHQISNISRTKSSNLNVSSCIFLCNILKPGVKPRMKM